MKNKVLDLASDINIGYIISFHEVILSELRRKEDKINEANASYEGNRKGKIDLLIERDLYASTYKQHLMSNTFLLLYSHLEEWLFLIWKTYAKSIDLNARNRGSIRKFKPVVQHVMCLDLSQDKRWQFLLQAEEIRNCLLHANARIDLSKDPQGLRSILGKHKTFFFEKNSRLYVRQAYVEKVFECVQYIISREAVDGFSEFPRKQQFD
jgi:hypothetical protein